MLKNTKLSWKEGWRELKIQEIAIELFLIHAAKLGSVDAGCGRLPSTNPYLFFASKAFVVHARNANMLT